MIAWVPARVSISTPRRAFDRGKRRALRREHRWVDLTHRGSSPRDRQLTVVRDGLTASCSVVMRVEPSAPTVTRRRPPSRRIIASTVAHGRAACPVARPSPRVRDRRRRSCSSVRTHPIDVMLLLVGPVGAATPPHGPCAAAPSDAGARRRILAIRARQRLDGTGSGSGSLGSRSILSASSARLSFLRLFGLRRLRASSMAGRRPVARRPTSLEEGAQHFTRSTSCPPTGTVEHQLLRAAAAA